MSDVDRVLGWFRDGTLLRPDPDVPNMVDLSRAIASVATGDERRELTANAQAIAGLIGQPDHVVFVLVDGLGTNLFERLPADSFFRRHLALELRTVFPSSTAPCLTSLATGLWPADHGVPGWFMFLEKRRCSIMVLPFADRLSQADARNSGVTSEEVFTIRPQTAQFRPASHWVMPKALVGSVYTTYSCGGATQIAYDGLELAVERIARIVADAVAPTYTYWYIPHVDYVEHQRGASHRDVAATVIQVEAAVSALAERLAGRARIVVTADHGQIDIPDEQRHDIPPGDAMLRHLLAPPSCEPRVPAFHVHPGAHEEFASEFRARFGATWALLTLDEVDEMRLFGPEPLTDLTRARLGEYLGLNDTHEILMVPNKKKEPLLGSHGGLLADEMLVPLILA